MHQTLVVRYCAVLTLTLRIMIRRCTVCGALYQCNDIMVTMCGSVNTRINVMLYIQCVLGMYRHTAPIGQCLRFQTVTLGILGGLCDSRYTGVTCPFWHITLWGVN